jgi:RNA polymerase sigma factor (TIGR02999 family)
MDDRRALVTLLLRQSDLGDTRQAEALLSVVYDELRELAAQHLGRERGGHTLQPTALVHEVYLRLVQGDAVDWQGRAHFFGVSARAMRQVLIDHARRRRAEKRGGGWEQVTLQPELMGDGGQAVDLLDLHDALEKLSQMDERLGRLVELRFFGGLTLEETAQVLGVSLRKANKDWSVARVWLARELARS